MGGHTDLFTTDVYLKCFQRYFLTKNEETLSNSMPNNMLLRISSVGENNLKNQTALLQLLVSCLLCVLLKNFLCLFLTTFTREEMIMILVSLGWFQRINEIMDGTLEQ